MNLINRSFHLKPIQTGFTLLEMVLVLFLISLMASATLFLTENVEDQAKYDETKRRMEIIRQAIVGDPTRKLNCQTEISGFASDMGRLPNCVAELLTAGTASGAEYQSPCDNSLITSWTEDSATEIWFGWNGPYIQVLPERDGRLRFRDGYNNFDATQSVDAINSGWNWGVYDSSSALNALVRIRSAGINSLFDDTDDYPSAASLSVVEPLIHQRNHLSVIDTLSGRV